MEALIKVKAEELGIELLDKIKALVQNNESAEIIIQVKEAPVDFSPTESPADYLRQLQNSVADKETGRTTVFTVEELKRYVDDNFS